MGELSSASEELFVTTKGDPSHPAVVCIHGLMGSSRNLFRLTSSIVEKGFFVIAYDQRGHGHSPHLSAGDAYSFELFAKDVVTVLDQKNIQTAHLVGHSLGARVSLTAAATYPERVKSLVMLDAGVTIHQGAHEELTETLNPLPPFFESKQAAEEFLSFHEDRMRSFLISNLRNKNDRYEWIMDLEGLRNSLLKSILTDQSENFRSVQCPILIVKGALSDHFQQSEMNRMLSLNDRASGVLISSAGHWLHVDNFEETSSAVTQFLLKVEKESA